jgi:hypothetical protein
MLTECRPLILQMKGLSKFSKSILYEHKGESGTWYKDYSFVEKGILTKGGVEVQPPENCIAIHPPDETAVLTSYTKDGVPVEFYKVEEIRHLPES